jgi:hypothetical protein
MTQKRRRYRVEKFVPPGYLDNPGSLVPCQKLNVRIDGVICATKQLQQTSDCRNQKRCIYKDEKNAIRIVAKYYHSRKEAGQDIDSLYRLIPRCYMKYQRTLLKELDDIIDTRGYLEQQDNPLSKVRI